MTTMHRLSSVWTKAARASHAVATTSSRTGTTGRILLENRQRKCACRNMVTTTTTTTKTGTKLGTLRVWGSDRHGIVSRCTQVLGTFGCNIVKSEHWTDVRQQMFFQRLAFAYDPHKMNSDAKEACQEELRHGLQDLQGQEEEKNTEVLLSSPAPLQSSWNWRDRRKKIGIMVSKFDHCLWELLLRHSAQELENGDIHVIVSNHETLRHVAETFDIPYHYTPMHVGATAAAASDTTLPAQERAAIEQRQLELLRDVDVVVLARYMQVLSSDFMNRFPADGIINIHHSFLPAFVGGSPYHQAHDRGVKLIGATAHYTTEELDDGPIIEQDVIAVSHRDSVKHLMKKGRILERNVLLNALQAHLDDRVLVHGNRCVVFGD